MWLWRIFSHVTLDKSIVVVYNSLHDINRTTQANTIHTRMGENGVCCNCSSTTTTNTISHLMTYILPTLIVTLATIGLLSNFLFIFFMDDLEEANESI